MVKVFIEIPEIQGFLVKLPGFKCNFLPYFLVYKQNQGHFLNLHTKTFPKMSLVYPKRAKIHKKIQFEGRKSALKDNFLLTRQVFSSNYALNLNPNVFF